jgi:DNA-binding HxlR family transcriptional regulator
LPAVLTVQLSPNPITQVLDVVFSRWTTPILWALNEHGR